MVRAMAVTANLSKYLDAEYEDAPLEDVLAAPVTALAGVTEADAEALRKAFRIKTVADLGRNKYFCVAQALAQLGK